MLVARETLTLLFETDYYSIQFDAALQAVLLTYKRKGSSDEFRELHYKLLEAFDKVAASKILVETQEMAIVAPEDQRWVGQFIIPQIAKKTENQFLYAAVVAPKGIFTKLAVDTVEEISMGTGTCINKSFDNTAEARMWLSEQKPVDFS
ncbi:hypothetical protein ACFSRY_11235 [Pontibacter locisalis]|uniref:STAS/SEC14 domain-containing protein n=1 Tax=Pontibacter locisalis TaxID=1719035 RepID=A0ABW5INA5_9BACT